MKTMKIEKKLLFDDKIITVTSVTADEKLTYKKEEDGSIRASGPLFIRGEMVREDGGNQRFQEVLDMDVLAPAYKLGSAPFHLAVESVVHQLEEDGIALNIVVGIEGLNEEHSSTSTQAPQYTAPIMEPRVEIPVVNAEASEEVNAVNVEVDEDSTVSEDFEDLFEDADTTYTSYRMVVALSNDTYGTIAQRYDVMEEELRQVNRNKELQPKSLVVLPF